MQQFMRFLSPFHLIALVALLHGCSTVNPYADQGVATSSTRDRTGHQTAPAAPTSNTPVPVRVPERPSVDSPVEPASQVMERVPKPVGPAAFLLAEATRYQEQKNYAAAAVSIERAMRIDAGNPWLSLAMANIRVDQENPGQAETFARRALARAGSDTDLSAQCWRTIAAARTLSGDHSGAEQALRQAGQSN